ncbi:MAG TPA: hypothetical protein DCE71_07940 [Parachlamydiales bacterium]|nr:hypothetical protein [Parachlamydiales bacterium]
MIFDIKDFELTCQLKDHQVLIGGYDITSRLTEKQYKAAPDDVDQRFGLPFDLEIEATIGRNTDKDCYYYDTYAAIVESVKWDGFELIKLISHYDLERLKERLGEESWD